MREEFEENTPDQRVLAVLEGTEEIQPACRRNSLGP